LTHPQSPISTLKRDGSVQLSYFSAIEEAAAEKLLTGHDLLGWQLELDGLTTLSDSVVGYARDDLKKMRKK
jgi:hypothetical protein